MNKLVIGIVGLKWPPETFLQRLIRGLVACDIKVKVLLHDRPDAAWRNLPNFEWKWVPRYSLTQPFVRQLQLLFFKTCNVIYFPWNSSAIENSHLFQLGIPVVISCRGAQVNIAPHNPERKSIIKGLEETFQKAAKVHCVSEAILKEAMTFGLNREKAVVIYPAVNHEFFYPEKKEAGPNKVFHLISIGSLIWRKGYEYMLTTLRELLDDGLEVKLFLIGDGPERQRILYTLWDLNLTRHVELLGELSPEEVRDRLRHSDFFIFSSLSEGISNAVLEAMACCVPAISTDCGGMTEVIENQVDGVIVPVRDPKSMAKQIKHYIQNPELRLAMGRTAREKVLQKFLLENHIQQFVQLFESALNKRAK